MSFSLKTKITSIVLSCKNLDQLVVTRHWIQDMPMEKHDQEQFEFIIKNRQKILEKEAKDCALV